MKKTMIMIVFFLALGSQAIAKSMTELNIRTNANIPLKVIIDGQLVHNNSTIIKIQAIPAGKHSLQVFRILSSFNSYNEEPLFFGEIFLPQNTVTNALIKHHKFIIEEQFVLNVIPQNTIYNYQNNHYQTKPIFWTNNYQTIPQAVVCTIQQPIIVQEIEPIVEDFSMSPQDFQMLKNAINNEWFSDGKLLVLEQVVHVGHLFTSLQVKELLDLYSFSGDKLEVAKMSYHNTIDSENYFIVYDTLHWSSSKQNLSNYIASL